MTHPEIARQRMCRQRLWQASLTSPEEVVHCLAAMQAQEFAYAKWSIAQRANGVTCAQVDRALAEGRILRTHLLRPTWHFVLPADIRWLLKLTAPRIRALHASYYRNHELDSRLLARSNALIAKSLGGGRQLTRKELSAVFERAGLPCSGTPLAHLMMHAELDGIVCSGAVRGKQQTYVLLDERVPPARSMDRDEALAELMRRYFTTRGPATVKDFLQWSSLTAADGRSGLEMLRPGLQSAVVDGRTYWFVPSSPVDKPAAPAVDLVQCYDECIMSYTESKDVLRSPGTVVRNEPVFLHAILLDGQLAGRWRHAIGKREVIVEADLHRPLNRAAKHALAAAVERYGQFLEMPAISVFHSSVSASIRGPKR